MKKAFLFAAVVISAVAGTVCYNHQAEEEMSDMAKANVEALAKTNVEQQCHLETVEWTCSELNDGDYCICGWNYGEL